MASAAPAVDYTQKLVQAEAEASLALSAWRARGMVLSRQDTNRQFEIGDWLLAGKPLCGAGGACQAAASIFTGYTYSTLYNLLYVARAVPASLRNEKLSWNHHYIVAGQPNKKALLDLCEKEGWSSKQLRKHLKIKGTKPGKPLKRVDAAAKEASRVIREWYRMVDANKVPLTYNANQFFGALLHGFAKLPGWQLTDWNSPEYKEKARVFGIALGEFLNAAITPVIDESELALLEEEYAREAEDPLIQAELAKLEAEANGTPGNEQELSGAEQQRLIAARAAYKAKKDAGGSDKAAVRAFNKVIRKVEAA